MKTLRFASALLPTLLLGACGYGWEETPRVYPPSGGSQGQVVGGTPPAEPESGDYLVQPGDTLFAIGFKNQLDWKDLARWNGIAGPDYRIRVGQNLHLSAQADTAVQTQPLGPVAIPPTGSPTPVPLPGSPVPIPKLPVAAAPAVPVLSVPPSPVLMPTGGPSLRWSWPTAGKLVRGYNLAAGAKGIDISGEIGQPVNATSAGKVVYSGSALKGYGELVIVKHDDTYLSAYGYNRRRLVKEGDEVRAGQTIAELGLGPEQKPALHFEIREHGKPVDPLKFLPSN